MLVKASLLILADYLITHIVSKISEPVCPREACACTIHRNSWFQIPINFIERFRVIRKLGFIPFKYLWNLSSIPVRAVFTAGFFLYFLSAMKKSIQMLNSKILAG